jgi:hypothetical protein
MRRRRSPVKRPTSPVSRLEEAPTEVSLQVNDDAVLLSGEADAIVQEILMVDIEKWEKRSVADGSRQKRCLVLTMLEGDEISLNTDKAETIVRMLNEREKESSDKAAEKAAAAAAQEEAAAATQAAEPEPEPEPESATEEGVPPPDGTDAAEAEEGGDADEDEDEEEEEEEAEDPDDYTVMQDSLRGSRVVELGIKRSGLMLSESGDSVVYAFANLQSWSAEPGQRCTVYVSAGAGLVTDFTFKTDDAIAICSRLHLYACQVARSNMVAGLPGSKIEAEGASSAGADADLVAKLQALQEENQKLAEERAKAPASGQGSGGADVNAELSAALKATQTELQEVKKKLEAARKAQQQKQKDESEGASDLSSRIVEMEQTISTQGQQLRDAAAKVEAAKAEAAAEVQEQLSKSRAECEGWKRKSEAATELADKLTAAGGDGGAEGGGAVIAALSAEKEKLSEDVEKLKKNGATVMAKLQETMGEAKAAKDAMEKMKKAREKVSMNIKRSHVTPMRCVRSLVRWC